MIYNAAHEPNAMNKPPLHSEFNPSIAMMCGEFARAFMAPAPAPSFNPAPRVGAPTIWTPEMRAEMTDYMEKCKIEDPSLNAKERKKLARSVILTKYGLKAPKLRCK